MELNKDLNLSLSQKERILEKIRGDVQGRNSFRIFLAKEFAEENLLFIEEVEKFDATPQDDRYLLGFKIFETYVKSGCEREVNVEAKIRKQLTEKFEAQEIKKFMFRDAQAAVLETLRDDNLVRYMQSDVYENYINKLKEEREQNQRGVGAKSPNGGSGKSPGISSLKSPSGRGRTPTHKSGSPLPGSSADNKTFDDVFDLMLRVYEDVHESNHADALQDMENSTGTTTNVTDFEMFLALEAGGMYQTTPLKEKKEKKEKKQKDESEKKGFWARMTDERRRKKDSSDVKRKGNSERPPPKKKNGEEKEKKKEEDEFASYLK